MASRLRTPWRVLRLVTERRFDLDGGKYTVILNSDGYTVTALRHGEPWRDFVGDKFVSLLVQEFFERVPVPIEQDPAPRSEDFLPVGTPELPSRVDAYQSPEANGHRWPCSLYYAAAQDLLNYTCSCGRIPWAHCDRTYLHAPHRWPDRVMQCGGIS